MEIDQEKSDRNMEPEDNADRISPRQYYRSRHPDYFSDSYVDPERALDRSMLEFHLASLTQRSQEADFERFARRLCEKCVCPNLVPTTGPTGGGDSKADSETFPVAETLTLAWFSGTPKVAAKERWAFAFSTMAKWRPKLSADVKKIVETGRGYTKAIFVTNQCPSAKQRSAAEDKLTKEYGIEVRILDRTWILEQVFNRQLIDIAIEELKITPTIKPAERVGPNDAERKEQLESIERRIEETIQAQYFTPALVDDALEAADLARSLERPRVEVEGRYGRANQLATTYGTARQQVETAYQWVWTLFWWYEDFVAVVDQYTVVEERAKESENVFDLERLMNLWTVLQGHKPPQTSSQDHLKWLNEHAAILRTGLQRLAGDAGRPSTALQARAHLLQIELCDRRRRGADLDEVFGEFESIIQGAEGLVGFPVQTVTEVLSIVGEGLDDSPAYDRVFDLIVTVSAKRESEIKAARLLLKRGQQLFKLKQPAKAIALVGQALGRLYKHETRSEIVTALLICGAAYERVGLLWAARATYVSAASIAANDLWRYGEVSLSFLACVNRMKWIELQLGRLPHILAWHELDQVLVSQYASRGEDVSAFSKGESQFNAILARLLIRTPFSDLASLEAIPDILDELQLHPASECLLFLLGHTERAVDAERILEMTSDEALSRLYHMEAADASLPLAPLLYDQSYVTLSSKVLGSTITANSSTAYPCVEVAEWVLSILESLLATSAFQRAFAYEPDVSLEVVLADHVETDRLTTLSSEERLGRPHFVVACQEFDPYQMTPETQGKLADEVYAIAISVLARTIHFSDHETDLTTLFRDERVLDRAVSFTGTGIAVRNVLGEAPKFRITQWIRHSLTTYPLLRAEPWTPHLKQTQEQVSAPISSDQAADTTGLWSDIRHDEMELLSPIRNVLWDKAGWSGCLYMWDGMDGVPPVMGLLFTDKEAGRNIFASWRTDFGEVDKERSLRITVVRGIDKQNPHKYRVLIGPSLNHLRPSQVILAMYRIHTVDATTSAHLDGFLSSYNRHKRFTLVPAFITQSGPDPDFDVALELHEISVRNAWEIGRHDIESAGVLPEDDVIIPDGVCDPPVIELQAWKREHPH